MPEWTSSLKTNNGRTTHIFKLSIESHSTNVSDNSSKGRLRLTYTVQGYDNFQHLSNVYLKVGSDIFVNLSRHQINTVANGTITLWSHDNLYWRHSDSGLLSLSVEASFETVQKGLAYLPNGVHRINGTYTGPTIPRSVRLIREPGPVYLWHPLDSVINNEDEIYFTFEKTHPEQRIEAWYKIGSEYWEALNGRAIEVNKYNSNQYWIIFWDETRKKMAEIASKYEDFPPCQISVRTHNPGGTHVDNNYNVKLAYYNPDNATPQIYSVRYTPNISIPENLCIQNIAEYTINVNVADANTPESQYNEIRNYNWRGQTSIYKDMSLEDMKWCLKYYVGRYSKYNFVAQWRNENGDLESISGNSWKTELFNLGTKKYRFTNSGTYILNIWTKNARSTVGRMFGNQRQIEVLPYELPIINSFTIVRNPAKVSTELIFGYSFKWYPVHTLQILNAEIQILDKETKSVIKSQSVLSNAKPSETTITSKGFVQGNFLQNKEYIAKLLIRDVSNTEMTIEKVIPMDLILMHVGPNGLGVGKPHENGNLDVKGEIYSGGKRIQHFELTNPDGTVRRIKTSTNGSGDEYRTPGQYWVEVSDGGIRWALLEVFKITDKEIFQRFTIWSTNTVWYRLSHYETGEWMAWKKSKIE